MEPRTNIDLDSKTGAERQKLLTMNEVATILRCSKAHLSKLINARVANTPNLSVIRLGRRVLIRRETLESYLRTLDIPTDLG